ncbi:hypothetical protein VIGAN_06117900 [Vigna angularis var. angularis]|uniref:Uncharacterized protein n=1 Tax=Vigna angularis var. angularis TaxID=157739 RepID=A0A0S3SB36_PHAAN|nr:hypothetical protein VIGAN_06117900 [Vigna angularis var. angularis]
MPLWCLFFLGSTLYPLSWMSVLRTFLCCLLTFLKHDLCSFPFLICCCCMFMTQRNTSCLQFKLKTSKKIGCFQISKVKHYLPVKLFYKH